MMMMMMLMVITMMMIMGTVMIMIMLEITIAQLVESGVASSSPVRDSYFLALLLSFLLNPVVFKQK